jgi:hypothetical protein
MPMVTRIEAANLTPREVTLLAEVPKSAVEKAIEEKVLTTRIAKKAGGNIGYLVSSRQAGHAKAREYRHLGAESVVYIALVKKLGVTLNKAGKKALAARLRHLKLDDMHSPLCQ